MVAPGSAVSAKPRRPTTAAARRQIETDIRSTPLMTLDEDRFDGTSKAVSAR